MISEVFFFNCYTYNGYKGTFLGTRISTDFFWLIYRESVFIRRIYVPFNGLEICFDDRSGYISQRPICTR
jgi:hypothetical protein